MQAGWSPHSVDEGELGGWTLSSITEKAPSAMQIVPLHGGHLERPVGHSMLRVRPQWSSCNVDPLSAP
ncbi:unnamed protein product [Calypogeia fissa]